jgi:hypothetical protein
VSQANHCLLTIRKVYPQCIRQTSFLQRRRRLLPTLRGAGEINLLADRILKKKPVVMKPTARCIMQIHEGILFNMPITVPMKNWHY